MKDHNENTVCPDNNKIMELKNIIRRVEKDSRDMKQKMFTFCNS
jgi:hypothetical protein